jgi:uncharacterized protein (UPF0332 family)
MSGFDRLDYVKYRLQKAEETMDVAELLIDNKKWNSAVNRLYYAISALLIYDNVSAKTHAGVKTQFFLHYIKSGKIEASSGKLYADLFDWRQKGDYNDFFDFEEELVVSLLIPCKSLLSSIKKLIST